MTDLTPNHPAVEAAARAALKNGWTCDTHEPEEWGVCPDCTESHLRTAHRALTAALPHLTADEPEALPPTVRAAVEHTFHALGLPIPPNPDLDGPDRLTLRGPDGRPSLTITHGGTPGTAASLHLHTPAGTWGARLTADEALAAADVLTRLADRSLPCGCENPLNAVHLLDH